MPKSTALPLPESTPSIRKPLQQRHLRDLRGATRLATDATLALAALVEAMHAGIASPPGFPGGPQARGLSGLVYKSVRGVTRLVGGSLDGVLATLMPMLAASGEGDGSSSERDAVLAVLNGVLGDHLAATANPLALPMTLRHQGQTLDLRQEALAAALPTATGRVLVLLHGLCMNDRQWLRDGHDHGAALARAAGYTPLYLRYNSGLSIQANGAAFALQMQALLAAWPQPLQRVALLGHSMGGLVVRSALHQGAAQQQTWVQQVDDAVFLGTPHLGAPLERAGHWVDLILGAAPYAAPLARLGGMRSAGITDLRHGNLLGGPPNTLPVHVPLPAKPRCYAIAGTAGSRERDLKDRLLGDGLVPLASALGRHADAARCLHFEPARQLQLLQTNHLALLGSAAVAAALLRWLA
jgi:hypothetical protein